MVASGETVLNSDGTRGLDADGNTRVFNATPACDDCCTCTCPTDCTGSCSRTITMTPDPLMSGCCSYTIAVASGVSLTPNDLFADLGTCTYRATIVDPVCLGAGKFKIYCSGGVWYARFTIDSMPIADCATDCDSEGDFWEVALDGCVGPCPPTGHYTMIGDAGNFCSLDIDLVIT